MTTSKSDPLTRLIVPVDDAQSTNDAVRPAADAAIVRNTSTKPAKELSKKPAITAAVNVTEMNTSHSRRRAAQSVREAHEDHDGAMNSADREKVGASAGRVGDDQSAHAAVSDLNIQAAVLEELAPAIETARAFAERWREPYRLQVFRTALDRLVGPSFIDISRQRPPSGAPAGTTTGGVLTPARPSGARRGGEDGFSPYEKLARALNLDIDSIERLVKFGDDAKLHILARADGKTKKDLQTKYSLAYLYVKEVALGERMVDIDELRSLCVEHGCYDMANFTGNFGKDVTAGLLRQQGEKGVRGRKFLLSKKGLDEAAALLRELAAQ